MSRIGALSTLLGLWIACAAGLHGCGARQTPDSACLGGGTEEGTCRGRAAPAHALPFRPGYETRVMQGMYGYRTHKEDLAFSVDYKCKPGTPIVATAPGIVWAARDDSRRGCNDPKCAEDANYVVLDHGDGTYSEYHHLQQFGALVEPGDRVCRGEVLGLCGTTGYTSGPHIHFAVTDITRRTIPWRLTEASGRSFPYTMPDETYTSKNELSVPCSTPNYSRLPRDAFSQQAVLLDRPLPLVVRRDETETRLEGKYYGPHEKIALHRKSVSSGDWIDQCVPIDDDGRFRALIEWPDTRFDAGFHWFMLTGADEKCRSPGWAWSYKVRVD